MKDLPTNLPKSVVLYEYKTMFGNSDDPQLPTEAHKMRLWQKIISIFILSVGLVLNLKMTKKFLMVHDIRKPLYFELFTHGLLSIVSLSLCLLSHVSGVFWVQSWTPCMLGYSAGCIG